MPNTQILVAGAGPIGLFTSLLAAKQGFSVTLIDKIDKRPCQSRAIGITPPTLGIMEQVDLAETFISQGVSVSCSGGYTRNGILGKVDFSRLHTKYPFVLAIPQNKTEAILEQAVLKQSNIQVRYDHEITDITYNEKGYTVSGTVHNIESFAMHANTVFACDGGRSVIREKVTIPFTGHRYPHTFLMADYNDNSGWKKNEARLYFTKNGSVESFPLPDGKRRYVLRTPEFLKENTTDFLETNIPKRCGVAVLASDKIWESGFGVQRFIAKHFALPGLFLCGDAAHLMSPIGGQNMNTGFADAELAVWLTGLLYSKKISRENAATVYTKYRKIAANAAASRAELMMNGGTSGGTIWNSLRNTGTILALNSPVSSILYGMFTMLSIPNRDVQSCYPHIKRDLGL
jgi:2-polyprenyl-6-methoxyphenol hydroxylase-like FAD-dependent oxidoreductase